MGQSQFNFDGIPVFTNIERGPLEMWTSACAAIFEIAPMRKVDYIADYQVSAWFVDPITVSNSFYKGMVARHGRWHVEESGHQVHLHRYRHGRATVETDDTPIECETGEITLLDYSRRFTSLHTPSQCDSFYIPHTAIGYDPAVHPQSLIYAPHSILGQVLSMEMDHILATLRDGATHIARADMQRFLGCVETAISPSLASESARAQAQASLRDLIRAFIETRLSHPELTVDLVLSNFGLSRAGLYRMFQAEGGVRNYITRRRLQRAVLDIAENPTRRGQIHEAALRWGFASDTTFHRAVRREFGTSPGALFEMPIHGPADVRPRSIVHKLMNQAARPLTVAADKS
ncbi:MAG: AraC family transcriptional regulator [Pseudomonadota bacterium]